MDATCLAVHGVIAIGLQTGQTRVYSFDQQLQCILGITSIPVSCVSISRDATWVGVGHENGDIFLYDIASPAKPARTLRANTLAQVASGRKEGHLVSRITHIGFVGARHTSIVSGDEHGRVFWWSLGRIMGVDSNDVLRMLGNYEKQSMLYAASPLPLGHHSTDPLGLSALLTPAKLVIVGLTPPKTWYRKPRDVPHQNSGAAAWSPATATLDPLLAYSWGLTLRVLRVQTGAEIRDVFSWTAPSPIRSIHWFDRNVSDLDSPRVDD